MNLRKNRTRKRAVFTNVQFNKTLLNRKLILKPLDFNMKDGYNKANRCEKERFYEKNGFFIILRVVYIFNVRAFRLCKKG